MIDDEKLFFSANKRIFFIQRAGHGAFRGGKEKGARPVPRSL